MLIRYKNRNRRNVVEFDSLDEMKKYIVNEWSNWFKPEDIIIDKDVYYDKNIDWEFRYILIKRTLGVEHGLRHIGMCCIDESK